MSGVAGSVYSPEKKAAEILMTLNIPRGPHSTGLASIPRIRNDKQNVILVKELGTPYGDADGGPGIMGHKNYKKAMNQFPSAIITHNRWATKGEISRKNAHPFWFPNLVGTHNGTLDYSYRNKLLCAERYETDSECVFNTMNAWGVRRTISNMEGAYALVWYDLRENTINMIRNDQRPLHFAFDSKKECIFWSSDYYALAYGMDQARINRGDGKIYLLTPDTHFQWAIPNSGKSFEEARRETIKGFENKSWYYNNNNNNHGGGRFCGGQRNSDLNDDLPFDTLEENDNASNASSENNNQQQAQEKEVKVESRETLEGRINPATYSVDRSEVNVVDLRDHLITRSKSDKKVVDKLEKDADNLFFQQFNGSPVLGNKHLVLKHNGPFHKCYYDSKQHLYEWYEYVTLSHKWLKHSTNNAPSWLPYTLINVDSGGSHLFSYQTTGKGKNKTRLVFFKGFKGNLLSQSAFESIMADGCINCMRNPEWGNPVRFLDKTTFLCEHCQTPSITSLWKSK